MCPRQVGREDLSEKAHLPLTWLGGQSLLHHGKIWGISHGWTISFEPRIWCLDSSGQKCDCQCRSHNSFGLEQYTIVLLNQIILNDYISKEIRYTSYSLSLSTPTTATIWYCLALIEWSVRRKVRIKLALISVWNVCICFLLQLGSKRRSRWAPSLSSSIPIMVLLCPVNKPFPKVNKR